MKFLKIKQALTLMISFQFLFSTFPLNYGYNLISEAQANNPEDLKQVTATPSADATANAFMDLANAWEAAGCRKSIEANRGEIVTSAEEIQKDGGDEQGRDSSGKVINCPKATLQLAAWQKKIQAAMDESKVKKSAGDGNCTNCGSISSNPTNQYLLGAEARKEADKKLYNDVDEQGNACSKEMKEQISKERCDMTCGLARSFGREHPEYASVTKSLMNPSRGATCAGGAVGDCLNTIWSAFKGSLSEAFKTGTGLLEMAGKKTVSSITSLFSSTSDAEKKANARAALLSKMPDDKLAAAKNAPGGSDPTGALQNIGDFLMKSAEYLTNIQMFKDLFARFACAPCKDRIGNWCAAVGVLGKDFIVQTLVAVAFGGAVAGIAKLVPKVAKLAGKAGEKILGRGAKDAENVAARELGNVSNRVVYQEISARGRFAAKTLERWAKFQKSAAYSMLALPAKAVGKILHATSMLDPTQVAIDASTDASRAVKKFFTTEETAEKGLFKAGSGEANKVEKTLAEEHSMDKGMKGNVVKVATVPAGQSEAIEKGKDMIRRLEKASPVVTEEMEGAAKSLAAKEPNPKVRNRLAKLTDQKAKNPIPEDALKDVENAENASYEASRRPGSIKVDGPNGAIEVPIGKDMAKKGEFTVHTANDGNTVIVRNTGKGKANAKDLVFFKDENGLMQKAEVKPKQLDEAMGKAINGKDPQKLALAEVKENLETKGTQFKEVIGPDGEPRIEVKNGPGCSPDTIAVDGVTGLKGI